MTIALLTSSMDGGGAQRAIAKLAAGIAGTGREVDLVLAHARGPYLAELPPQVRVVDLGVSRLAAAVLPLARYLRARRPDALLSALDYVNVVAVLARAVSRSGVPLVVSERNTLSAAVAHTRNRSTRWMPRLLRLAYPHADAVVAVSRGVAEDLESLCGLTAGSVRVLDNPVVTPELVRMREEPVEHPWLRDRTVPVVLAVGRLVPQKDFGTLLDAFGRVRRERPARLVVLGEGPMRSQLQEQCARLGITEDVSLPGFCANPYPAMAAADVFVLSSRFEGSPGALIEAMSCGTPVVATDCPSGPRELLAGGRHGRLVPVGDSTTMAAGILDALAGRVAPPPVESWRRYEQASVVDACLALLAEVRTR
ncbi:MAG TPA: glycosyltransferase [Marmoricola sp.]